ncbi:hypothetical protein [Nocardia brasiliensis]|uniref:hypothetical protein n=1 Tax=Nocardia brasiliensis TaxID=37326 RepID=UPI0024562039|nr:hypothetical protein [Nocardia brasiliensis]
MSYPVGPKPDGAWQLGGRYGQDIDKDNVAAIVTSGAKASFVAAQGSHRTNVRDRIDGAYTQIDVVKNKADTAVTQAQAAANAAAAAESTAASAKILGSYWEAEFVVASAAVVLGVNELLIGLCQNVPGGLTRTITDMHAALLSQPNGMAFELKKWDATGTSATVLGTYPMAANVTRQNWPNLNFAVSSRERIFVNVTSVTGSTAPVVLQVLLFGVMQ